MAKLSVYEGERIVLTTQHQKEKAIGPPVHKHLKATLWVQNVDTDQLGTFSGEVERPDSPQKVVRQKAEWGIKLTGLPFGLATEGSFGPHPAFPICPSGLEIIHFVDQERDFHLQLASQSLNTNYGHYLTACEKTLMAFAKQSSFPKHGLMVFPHMPKDPTQELLKIKGIQNKTLLMEAFQASCQASSDGKAFVQTDMRAHMNPMRMKEIQRLTNRLAMQLTKLCPACDCPGWGWISSEKGLLCQDCCEPTMIEKFSVWGCVRCAYTKQKRSAKTLAEPQYCGQCNP